MNKRQKKMKWNKIHWNRYMRFCDLAMRVSIQTDIIQRMSDSSENDKIRIYLDKIKEEMENIRYDMTGGK